MSFVVAPFAFLHLFDKAVALIDRIVQFAEAVGQLAAVNKAFKTIGQQGIIRVLLAQRRNFQRVVRNDRRLNQVFFYVIFKAAVDNLADAVVFAVFDVQLVGNSPRFFYGLDVRKVFAGVFFDSFDHGHSVPGRRQVDFLVDIGNLHRAVQLHGQLGYHFFRNLDDVFQIAVGLVQFYRRKFRVVARVDAFVAEAAVHFIDSFQTADEQALQVQFRRNAQVNIHVEGVVVGLEGTGSRAAGNRVQHRRFYFQKAPFVQILTNALDNLGPFNKRVFYFRIDDEIQIPLAIARFLIRQAVEFFRQGTERLGQQRPFFNADRRFARVSRENNPFDADDIADIQQLEQGIRFFTQNILAEIQLDFAADIAKDAEGRLAVTADRHEAAGNADDRFIFFQGFCLVLQFLGMVIPVKFLTEGIDAGIDKALHLFAAHLHLVV